MIIRGFFPEDNPEGRTLKVYVNQKEVPLSITMAEGPEVRRRYLRYRMNVGQEITASLQLTGQVVTDFKICSCLGEEEAEAYRTNRKQSSLKSSFVIWIAILKWNVLKRTSLF